MENETKINFLSFCGAISAVKHLVITFEEKVSHESVNYQRFLDKFLKAKNTNKIVYRNLIEKKRKQPVNSQTRNGQQIACSKKMNLLTGRLLTGYLLNVRKSQNFAFSNLNCYTGNLPLMISVKK